MTPDAALELSIEQLIGTLNKKLFMECVRVQSATPPRSRALVATLTTEVRSQKLKGNFRYSRCILQVDALEERARDVLHEVITLRNSLRPVNHMPPEVLTSCATFVSNTDPRPIISLTHVCRYWRNSITSNPRAWASIATGWKRLILLCLERAGDVPLTVDITVSDIRGDEDFLKSSLPQASRIGRLRLTGYSIIETVADDLPGFLGSPIPNLTSLELQQTEEPAKLFPSREAPVRAIFQNVSKLESLSLTRTPLYPALLGTTSLRELKLLGYASPFHFGTFIGLLDSNPGLERLVLDIQFIANSVNTVFGRTVILPHLQDLSITCSKPIDSKELLSCIPLTRGAHIEVIATQLDQTVKLNAFLPSPPTYIRQLLTPITTVKIQVTPREIHLFGNNSTFTFRSAQTILDLHAELVLFPSTTVRELYTNTHPFKYTDTGLSTRLGQLPALETLAFSGTEFPLALLSALVKEPILCPALRTIAFFDCGINSDIAKELGEAIAKRRDSMAGRLYRVVIVSNGGMLPSLKSIQRLRKSVPCVEVRVDDKLPDLL